MSYILFLVVAVYGSNDITTSGFENQRACEEAHSLALTEFGSKNMAVVGFCVPKGEAQG